MEIKYGIRKVKEVQDYIRSVPRGTIIPALDAFAEYVVGNSRRGLKHDDPYRQTTRKKVFGQTFFSDKQRIWFFGAVKRGDIVFGQRRPNPTDASKGWNHEARRGGYEQVITNTSPGAYWSRAWGGWRNWRNVTKVIQDNLKGATQAATIKINEVLRKKGK